MDPYLSPYEVPEVHARVSAIIQQHSSNRADIRVATMEGIDLSTAGEVLDLGCGFGFWSGELARRVAPDACLTGIDACGSNEKAYLRCVAAAGRQGRFLRASLGSHLPFDDAQFDLVLAAYSLYFFLGLLPEVARVLRSPGRFLAVTHSENSFTGLLEAAGVPPENSGLLRCVRRFSAENGASLLEQCFRDVRRVEYRNTLCFHQEAQDDLLEYIRFKMPFLVPGARFEAGIPGAVVEQARDTLRRSGGVMVEKDDALFVCGGPRCA